ncbi:hypothetical protein NM688_g6433 [Phlebia brevispora]|uniref:Uncharacterized protein n=1 Tax=Phlebia brevispora TaxID=194682 RepID=A0ACC1SG58_9APHY|nr:hypothetical protein NM688_g6433 [Phlebia brevispora]
MNQDEIPPYQLQQLIATVIEESWGSSDSRPIVTCAQALGSIDFCIIKRSSISLFTLKDKLFFQKDIPLPSGATLARRTGRHLCVADHDNYNMIDLDAGLLFPLLPLSQAPDSAPVKPSITVIGDNEFLILSWTGASSLGVFITGEGDPVRGTLEWTTHPVHVACDYPHVTSLLSDNTIQIHNAETQAIVQIIPAPATATGIPKALICCVGGFFVPSMQRKEKLRPVPIKLRRPSAKANTAAEKKEVAVVPQEEDIPDDLSAL